MGWNGRRPADFALQILRDGDKHVRKITGEVLQQVVTRSPVMDGEYRASHKVSVNSPDNAYEKGFDLAGGATIQKGLATASTAKIGGIVYVQTNCPYGMRLENGHSKQAPNGVYALSFQSVVSKYK